MSICKQTNVVIMQAYSIQNKWTTPKNQQNNFCSAGNPLSTRVWSVNKMFDCFPLPSCYVPFLSPYLYSLLVPLF